MSVLQTVLDWHINQATTDKKTILPTHSPSLQIGKFAKCAGDIEFRQPFLHGQLSDIARATRFFCGLSVQFYYNFYYHVLLKCAGK